ncbi:hypothetical protein VNI00_009104 [Paramarasmius palmivorus]|uniref:Uncharacterized protein n=1 Tax=Paramarasmius palmivorus TaxID=297713 RepID=A0AAW0CU63_9AGAR
MTIVILELVPVSFVWERNGFSSALFIYFSYLAAQIDPELRLHSQPLRELWISPRNGLLRKGPYVEDSTNISYTAARFQTGLLSNTSDTLPALAFQEYNNTDVLCGYLSEYLSVHDILQGVRGSAKYDFELVKDEDAASILSSLPGTIYSRTSLDTLGRWSGGEELWYYHIRAVIPELSQEHMHMEDGSLRLTFMLSDMRDFQTFWLQYGLYPAKEWSALADTWLLLAHHIFHQFGVQQNEREFYSIYSGFWLHCECQEREPPQGPIDMPIETPVYLFLRPIPRPFDDKNTWNTWAQRKKYFWSFDPSGYPGEISDAENQQRNLGLPSLDISIVIQHRFWVHDHYDIIRMIHALQGFDPSSTDFARSFGFLYHKFEIFDPNSGRFEEIDQPERNQRSIKTWFRRLGQSLRIRRKKSNKAL